MKKAAPANKIKVAEKPVNASQKRDKVPPPSSNVKKQSAEDEAEDDTDSDLGMRQKHRRAGRTVIPDGKSLVSPPTVTDSKSKAPVRQTTPSPSPTKPVKRRDSSSSASSVLDEGPTKKRRRAVSHGGGGRKGAAAGTKFKSAAKAANSSDSPDSAEIKLLQSQLAKCGVRRLWHRELARCDTPGAKMSHLRSMLREVGMTGRFSDDKARAIKSKRELNAELEAVQEGNKIWGQESEDDRVGHRSSRRRLTRGRGAAIRQDVLEKESSGSGGDDEGDKGRVEGDDVKQDHDKHSIGVVRRDRQ